MPSTALAQWHAGSSDELDEIGDAHRAVEGKGPGRRYATLQINHAYAVLLAAKFQAFCRDLHSAAVDVLVTAVPASVAAIFRTGMKRARQLDSGNANPGTLGADFGRIGMNFWDDVRAASPRNRARQVRLGELNAWRNAIAHQDFTAKVIDGQRFDFAGGTGVLRLGTVLRWRSACEGLAVSFDRVVGAHLAGLVGRRPW